jgi:hypothetical protein
VRNTAGQTARRFQPIRVAKSARLELDALVLDFGQIGHVSDDG